VDFRTFSVCDLMQAYIKLIAKQNMKLNIFFIMSVLTETDKVKAHTNFI